MEEKLQGVDMDVEIIDITTAPLLAAAHHVGNYCKEESVAFMHKRHISRDAPGSAEEGKQLTECFHKFFRKVKENCNSEFTKHWKCLDMKNMQYGQCRETQKPFDACVLQNFGLECIQPTHLTGESI